MIDPESQYSSGPENMKLSDRDNQSRTFSGSSISWKITNGPKTKIFILLIIKQYYIFHFEIDKSSKQMPSRLSNVKIERAN